MPTKLDSASSLPPSIEAPGVLAALVGTSPIPRFFEDNPLSTFVLDSGKRVRTCSHCGEQLGAKP